MTCWHHFTSTSDSLNHSLATFVTQNCFKRHFVCTSSHLVIWKHRIGNLGLDNIESPRILSAQCTSTLVISEAKTSTSLIWTDWLVLIEIAGCRLCSIVIWCHAWELKYKLESFILAYSERLMMTTLFVFEELHSNHRFLNWSRDELLGHLFWRLQMDVNRILCRVSFSVVS